MRRTRYVSLLVLLVVSAVCAQEAWKKKPYKEWNKSEVEKLASDSPWAKTIEQREVVDYGTPMSYGVTIRLRSALQIRQALVRFNQLGAKYDSMGEAEKTAFDEKTKGLLNCASCETNYIITISAPIAREINYNSPVHFKAASLESLKSSVYIANDAGEKRELVQFDPGKTPRDEMTLVFRRLNEKGEPLLSTASKKLVFYFDPKLFDKPFSSKKVEFDVSKLVENRMVSF